MPENAALLIAFASQLDETMGAIAERIVDATLESVPGYAGVPREDLLEATNNTLQVARSCWREGRMAMSSDLPFDAEVVRRRARQGVNAGAWIAHGRVFTDLLFGELLEFARAHGYPDSAALDVVVEMAGSASDHSQFAHEQFELAAAEIAREHDDRLREALLTLLQGGLTPEKARAAMAAARADPDRLYQAVRVRPGDASLAERLNRREPTVGPRGAWVHADGEVVGLVPDGDAPQIDACGGIGPAVAVEGLPASFAVATAAEEAARRFGLRGLHRMEDLGILPLVLTEGAAADAAVERFVAAVERTGAAGVALVETVRAFLNSGLHPGVTAQQLHLHPNSLRKRLARYEAITGADLRSMDDLVAIWWALKRREVADG